MTGSAIMVCRMPRIAQSRGRDADALVLAKLRQPHGSVRANPLLAEPMYLAKYIERMGTGIGDMIRRCREAGLPEPTFAVTDGFVATVWRRRGEVTGEVAGEVAGEVTGEVAKLVLIWRRGLAFQH